MEHRPEIKSETVGKEIFFKHGLVEHETPHVYSLEEEFFKTKKHHDLPPYLIFFGFIILLMIATIGVGNYLDEQSKQVKINISDFEDLRLKETLSTAKEKEVELGIKEQELDSKAHQLKSKDNELKSKDTEIKNKNQQINQLNASFEKRIQQIKEELQHEADLKNADKKALKRLQDQEKRQMEALKKEYDSQTVKQQAEITRLQDQVKNLSAYQYGISVRLKEQKAAGCVIDPRQPKNLILFFLKAPKILMETEVDLYREQAEYIGRIKLIPDTDGIHAELVQVEKGETIKPLDWFKIP